MGDLDVFYGRWSPLSLVDSCPRLGGWMSERARLCRVSDVKSDLRGQPSEGW